MTSKLKLLVGASALVTAVMGSTSAYAAGTTQGTDILNTVTVDFQVGGVDQTQETATDLFEVDRRVDFTVTEATPVGTTNVSPGEQDAVTTFTLTNTSNDVLDFSLAASQLVGGTAEHGGTDNIDVTGLTFFVDDGDGVFNPATDTATSVNDLAADDSVTVFIVGDVPISAVTGDVAGVTLTATALNSDGSAITASTDADANTAGVETIFADDGRDGIEAGGDDYTIQAADLEVFKVSRVISDPVSSANPKAIPGAVVEYCIAVTNAAGSATATGITLSDDVNAIGNVTFDSSFTVATDGTSFDATTNTCTPGGGTGAFASGVVSGSLANIAGGETRTLVFRVIID